MRVSRPPPLIHLPFAQVLVATHSEALHAEALALLERAGLKIIAQSPWWHRDGFIHAACTPRFCTSGYPFVGGL